MARVPSESMVIRSAACAVLLACCIGLEAQQTQRAATQMPDADSSLLLQRAMTQYGSRAYDQCVATLSDALRRHPDDRVALLLRALAYGQKAQDLESLPGQTSDETNISARKDLYTKMSADLGAVFKLGVTNQDSFVNLVDCIVQLKLATLVTQASDTHPPKPEELRRLLDARDGFLARALSVIEQYLNPPAGSRIEPPAGLPRLQGQFFRAVVLYRQALRPSDKARQLDELHDRDKLDAAGEAMASLLPGGENDVEKILAPGTDRREVEARQWKSFATFYLGLVRVRQGNAESAPSRRATLYQDALNSFEGAKQLAEDLRRLDAARGDEVLRVVGEVYKTQKKDLEDAVQALHAGPAADLFLGWETRLDYDTNVILLGRNTVVPRDLNRTDDVRFYTMETVGVTFDLGVVAPENKELNRWHVWLMGRAGDNWNGAIEEFNEQDYGGSVALQYELVPAWGDGKQGPLYAAIQYDYDMFLLGNDGYLRSNRVTPHLTLYTFNQRSETDFAFTYDDRNYLETLRDERFDRDGNYFEFALSQGVNAVNMTDLYNTTPWKPWGLAKDPQKGDRDYDRWFRPHLGVQYSWDSTIGKEFDCGRWGFNAGIHVPLPYGVDFNFDADWQWEDYYHNGSLVDAHRQKREDFIQSYRLELRRQFVLIPGSRDYFRRFLPDRLVMDVRAGVTFTDDDSNVRSRSREDVYSYKRAIYGFALAFFYR